jgi:hypothetical protein
MVHVGALRESDQDPQLSSASPRGDVDEREHNRRSSIFRAGEIAAAGFIEGTICPNKRR